MPIETIHSPYRNIYCYLGDYDIFPELSGHYKIDGVYIHYDSIVEEFESEISRKIDEKQKKPVWHDDSVIEWEEYKKQQNVRAKNAEWRYQHFLEDIDSFEYQEGDYYLTFSILFTFINQYGQIREYTGSEILSEPVFRMSLDFKTHKTTVKEAIEITKNSTIAMIHIIIMLFINIVF